MIFGFATLLLVTVDRLAVFARTGEVLNDPLDALELRRRLTLEVEDEGSRKEEAVSSMATADSKLASRGEGRAERAMALLTISVMSMMSR